MPKHYNRIKISLKDKAYSELKTPSKKRELTSPENAELNSKMGKATTSSTVFNSSLEDTFVGLNSNGAIEKIPYSNNIKYVEKVSSKTRHSIAKSAGLQRGIFSL